MDLDFPLGLPFENAQIVSVRNQIFSHCFVTVVHVPQIAPACKECRVQSGTMCGRSMYGVDLNANRVSVMIG